MEREGGWCSGEEGELLLTEDTLRSYYPPRKTKGRNEERERERARY